MEKHSHYQEQLELSHQKLRHVEALGDKEHIKRNQEKYQTLAEKTREMGYKVRMDLRAIWSLLLYFLKTATLLQASGSTPAVKTNNVTKWETTSL